MSGMKGELAETLDAAEADGVWNLEEILKRTRLLMQTKKMRQSERSSCTVCWRGTRTLERQRS